VFILRNKNIGFRLILAAVIIIVSSLSLQTALTITREQDRARARHRESGRLMSTMLAYRVRLAVYAEDRAVLKDVVDGNLQNMESISRVGIYDAEFNELLSASKDGSPETAALKPMRPAISRSEETAIRETDGETEFVRPVVLKIVPSDARSVYFSDAGPNEPARTIGYVRMVLRKDTMNTEIRQIILMNAALAALLIGLSVAIVSYQMRRITRPLEELTRDVKALGRSEDVNHVTVESSDEIGRLAEAFNTMLDDRRASRDAFQKILMDIHDGIGGITTNISMLAELAQRAADPADTKRAVATIGGLARDGIAEIRSLMYSLDRSDLTWQSLCGELRRQGMKLVEPHAIRFDMTSALAGDVREPESLLCLHLFRIYREALMNVVKHAEARTVSVRVEVGDNRMRMIIADDGKGCPAGDLPCAGRGLSHMKTRAAEIGGQVTFSNGPGMRVNVDIPLV
jgi:signal transduction histidine kinase